MKVPIWFGALGTMPETQVLWTGDKLLIGLGAWQVEQTMRASTIGELRAEWGMGANELGPGLERDTPCQWYASDGDSEGVVVVVVDDGAVI